MTKPRMFVRDVTIFPRLAPSLKGQECHPCVRNTVLPMLRKDINKFALLFVTGTIEATIVDRPIYNRPTQMSLVPGSCVGEYEILAPIGAGGMGEVYRANDSKLRREVAIKVLPQTSRPIRMRWLGSSAKPLRSRRCRIRTSSRSTTSARRTARPTPCGAARGRDAAAAPTGAPMPSARRSSRRSNRGGLVSGARAGHRASRSEARERVRFRGRPREDSGFRPRPAGGRARAEASNSETAL